MQKASVADKNYRVHNKVDCSCMGSGSASPFDITADAASGMGCMAPEPPPNPPIRSRKARAIPRARPSDPNELTGPGVGAAGYVAAGQTLPYEVGFENEPTATAAAQEVTVTEPLPATSTGPRSSSATSPSARPSSPCRRACNPIPRPSTPRTPTARRFWSTSAAGLDLNTGVVTWTFRSVDPSTGQLPAGVDDGFLPPEDGTGRGTASVAYTILPLASLADGASFTSIGLGGLRHQRADRRPTPSRTPSTTWRPPAACCALPASSPSQFTVSWSGTDPDNGSGVAVYDVYVSTDGGPFVPFQTGTTATSATFTGIAGQHLRLLQRGHRRRRQHPAASDDPPNDHPGHRPEPDDQRRRVGNRRRRLRPVALGQRPRRGRDHRLDDHLGRRRRATDRGKPRERQSRLLPAGHGHDQRHGHDPHRRYRRRSECGRDGGRCDHAATAPASSGHRPERPSARPST